MRKHELWQGIERELLRALTQTRRKVTNDILVPKVCSAQRGCVGKNTNILNNYNVTQNLKRTIIYTKLHDMPLSWKLLFGYLHIFFFFCKSGK